ncbi:DUF4906 domain-containing protein [uncultured Muribaculum sp.]|uniref:DUF4906 domain-containing protein n=1 Tax=uncultured Muribaculum sp. TaxID=1918613 RepID=UPI00262BF704|nr:DUF4906 domain-containing protein [uncultured Muribaculum sp.]
MKIKFLYITLVLGLMLGLMSCQDDRLYDDSVIPDGDSRISATVSFESFTPALESRAAGTAINSIDWLWVVLFDGNGNFVNKYQILDYKSENVNTDKPTDWPSQEDPDWETSTPNPRATFNLTVPMGKYKMYAVANLDLSDKEFATDDDLKGLQLDWELDDIAKNKEMFGYFDTEALNDGASGFDASVVTIARTNVNLHAWLKRAASKVTVAFDGGGLKDQVQIYIKSISIKDIPKQCYLGKPNEVGLGYDVDGADRETLLFPVGEVTEIAGNKDGSSSSAFKPETNYHVCQAEHRYGGFGEEGDDASIVDKAHAPEAASLFFYENLQGTGDRENDKFQDADSDGALDYPGLPDAPTYRFKDKKPYGTYVEVEGYYVSKNPQNPGDGPIKFRFMLGKDIYKDYNAERNHHYKLTLMFKGYGNDADWHIEYEEPEGIVVPDPYYISYLYDQTMTLPIKVVGKNVNKIKVKIIENNWSPNEAPTSEYYSAGVNKDAVWNGFLSLRKTHDPIIEANPTDDQTVYVTFNKKYYEEHYRGDRIYRVDGTYEGVDNNDNDSKDEGEYSVTETNKGFTFNIPLYTRAKQMVPQTGYTGNNPYMAYQRTAKIRITAVDKDDNTIGEPREVTIIQVRRIVNPKGVWRKWNNDDPFHVVLKRLPTETATNFEEFNSDGPWSAEVEFGSDWIKLSGGTTKNDKVTGRSETPIDFWINPQGNTEGENNVRYGIIKVLYHNYTCVHRIFVRQGYAASPIRSNGTIKWQVFNRRTKSEPTEDPREEGNMFRLNRWWHPIDASNNTKDVFDQDRSDVTFELYGANNTTWNLIGSGAIGENFNTSTNDWRMPTHNDYMVLRKNYETDANEVDYGYGVLYADGATQTADDIVTAYEYRRNSPKTYGMRGCFVYNNKTGANLFFPIGASGYGRIKHGGVNTGEAAKNGYAQEKGKTAVLKYSNRSYLYGSPPAGTDRPVEWLPLFYDIYKRPGAIYWTDYSASPKADAWDINYFTFDFNTFLLSAHLYGSKPTGSLGVGDAVNASDAAFIRGIEK